MSERPRILVPTDFSGPSDAALDYARGLAARLGAELLLLHVVEEPTGSGPLAADVWAPGTPGVRDSLLRDATARLATRLARLNAAAAATEVIFGRPADTIAAYAAARAVELIVMGTHGRSGVAHLLLGSVAEKVIRISPCPVVIVREGATSAGPPA